jgi:hypothetical protein
MPKTLDNRSKVDHELRKLGFGGLNDPNLIPSIAFFIKTHEQFRGQLFSVMPEKRRIAYEALRPHLRFAAKPLDVYEAEIKELAERQQLPGFNPATGEVIPFKAGSVDLDLLATEAIQQKKHEDKGGILELVCTKCTGFEHFRAAKKKDAQKEAHSKGWRSDGGKTYCPQHVPGRATMTLACTNCEIKQRIRVWDQQDGYAAARIRGWQIGDAALCPECNAKEITVQ